MPDITRYVLVDRDNVEGDHEYDDYKEAVNDAMERGTTHAVVERQYTFSDSELVWTPDGSSTWPPKPAIKWRGKQLRARDLNP